MQAQQQKNSNNPPATLQIDAYDLAGLLQQVQDAVQQGYSIDLTTNENYPVIYGTRYCLVMLQGNAQEGTSEALQRTQQQESTLGTNGGTEAAVEPVDALAGALVEAKGKPGRKAKG